MSSSNASSLLRPAPEAWATGVIPVARNSQARQPCTLYPRQSTTWPRGGGSPVALKYRPSPGCATQQAAGSDVSSVKTTKRRSASCHDVGDSPSITPRRRSRRRSRTPPSPPSPPSPLSSSLSSPSASRHARPASPPASQASSPPSPGTIQQRRTSQIEPV